MRLCHRSVCSEHCNWSRTVKTSGNCHRTATVEPSIVVALWNVDISIPCRLQCMFGVISKSCRVSRSSIFSDMVIKSFNRVEVLQCRAAGWNLCCPKGLALASNKAFIL